LALFLRLPFVQSSATASASYLWQVALPLPLSKPLTKHQKVRRIQLRTLFEVALGCSLLFFSAADRLTPRAITQMAGSAFETPMYQYVHATGVAMGITPAEPSLSGLRRKNPLLQVKLLLPCSGLVLGLQPLNSRTNNLYKP